MANKITLTRDYERVEKPFTVQITGTNLKNKVLKVFYAKNTSGTLFIVSARDRIINNNTSYSASYTPTQSFLQTIYDNTATLEKVQLIIQIFDSATNQVITSKHYTTYLTEESPEFDGTSTYRVIDSETLALTNDDQVIINGMSTVEITNIRGTAYKSGYINLIKVGDNAYNYSAYEQENKLIISNITIPQNESFHVSLIDSRGWESLYECIVNPWESEFKLYHKPIIKDITVEREGIVPTTKLSISGVYTEGYEEGIEALIPTYKYQEITSDGSGTIENGETIQYTITRRTTSEWQDYLSILEEYNNPHYVYDENRKSYYRKYIFENGGIKELFDIALKYNNKYTQKYLEKDYDEINQRYYCKSGVYPNWSFFWQDTLVAIKQKMYGTYIYGQQDKDYGNGGNYEFEIEYSSIIGDISEGFTLDKAFNIWAYLNENTFKESIATTLLSTAIPAIDVYKDKVALHNLFDETIDESDIQLWGNTYLNGVKINTGMLQAFKTTDTTNYSTNYSDFSPFNGDGTADVDISTTNRLTFGKKSVTYGDRTNNSVYGVTIGAGVNLIKVTFHVRYLNNSSATTGINTIVYKNSNGNSDIIFGTASFAPTSVRMTESGICYIEVEEGDFVFIGGFKSTKSSDIDVISTNNNTSMIVEIIS